MSGLSNLTNSFNLKASGRGLTQPASAGTLDLQGRDGGVVIITAATNFVLPKAPEGTIVYAVGQAAATITDTAGSSLSVAVADNEIGLFISQNSDGAWSGVLLKSTSQT